MTAQRGKLLTCALCGRRHGAMIRVRRLRTADGVPFSACDECARARAAAGVGDVEVGRRST